jgi:hypothetical protein
LREANEKVRQVQLQRRLRRKLLQAVLSMVIHYFSIRGSIVYFVFPGFDEAQATNYFAVLSLQDYYSGNMTYANLVTSNMQIFNQKFGFYPGSPRDNGDARYASD